MRNDKRIIEIAFPAKEVGEQGARRISGIHSWWARRPLGPSRATCYAALSTPELLHNELSNIVSPPQQSFIAELAEWENALKPDVIDKARRDILAANNGERPKVLDPFGGGGSIPLEAQRLGCETYSCDLNPVAVLIQKCTLEYPQKYGERLHADVKLWGERVLAEWTKELAPFYPNEADGSTPFAYIWARTIPCQKSSCNAEIPLMRSFYLAKRKGSKNKEEKKVSLFPYEQEGQVSFQLVGSGYNRIPNDFDPAKGTVKKAVATCPVCKHTIPAQTTRQLFQKGEVSERMLAVVTEHPNTSGKRYRLPTDADLELFNAAQNLLAEKREHFLSTEGMDAVPDEATPKIKGSGAERALAVRSYNLDTYGELFNSRQQLSLITIAEKIREASPVMLAQGYPVDYARVVLTYLGLWLNQIAENSSNLCRWANQSESTVGIFGRAAMPMVWDYGEANALRIAGNRLKTLLKSVGHLSRMQASPTRVQQVSATAMPYPDEHFDAVLTDPPYYDNIPYAYLADFFYVWLKRTVGEFYPEFFGTPLTPKQNEVVAYGHNKGGLAAGKRSFEKGLRKAFEEIYRVLKPNGVAVIVYAHKSKDGWETVLNSLLDSGLVITIAWPISTEVRGRLRDHNSAALASSIYIVARKTTREPFGLYQEVRNELEGHLPQRLMELWGWGFSGADLFIAAIGNALQVFSKYQEVRDAQYRPIRADKMLDDIQQVVTKWAIEQVGVETATPLTRFYLLWRQEHGEKRLRFDEANKLAHVAGIDLAKEWGEGRCIQQEKEFVRVLSPKDRNLSDITGSDELIDILHHVLKLWKSNNREGMILRLAEDNVGLDEHIWKVAQAISSALPIEAEERKWLEGWLADRDNTTANVRDKIELSAQWKFI